MRNFISSMFSNQNNSNNIFQALNLSEYTSIKNGSYRKLLKSYYQEEKNNDINSAKNTDTKKDSQLTDTSGLSKVKQSSDELGEAVQELSQNALWNQTNGQYDREKITSAVKNFTEKYNSLIKATDNSSAKDVTQSTNYLKSMTSTMSKSLAKIGITVNFDGKMSVDEAVLKNADINSVKNLFAEKVSYGSQVGDKAGEISKAAIMNASIYGSDGTLSASFANLFNTRV